MKKNIDKSKKLKKVIRSKPQQCYANAWGAIETQEEYQHATYVEGMAVTNRLVIEHGWIEHDDEIIDPTLLDANIVYFPGLRFKGREGLDSTWSIPGMLESGMKLPIFYRFGWGGVESPEFLQAIIKAYRFAGMDAVAESYLKNAPPNFSFAWQARSSCDRPRANETPLSCEVPLADSCHQPLLAGRESILGHDKGRGNRGESA